MVRIGEFGGFGRIPQIRRDGTIERTGRIGHTRQMGCPGGADSAPGRGIIVVGNLAFQGQQTRRKAAARNFRTCILANGRYATWTHWTVCRLFFMLSTQITLSLYIKRLLFLKIPKVMTKLNEIKDLYDLNSKRNYSNEIRTFWRNCRDQTLTRVTNYLFILNSGALLAALTYVAAKIPNSKILCSIWLFAAGTFFSLAHAAIDYYITEFFYSSYEDDLGKFLRNEIDWETLIDQEQKRLSNQHIDWLLHFLGILSGAAFIFGTYIGISQIK